MDSIFTRRSVRSYLTQKVEDEKIDKILRAAMQAPSASNKRPWEFIVMKDEDNIAKFLSCNLFPKCNVHPPLIIIILGNENSMKSMDIWQQDLGACTQNLLLQVAELNLGAVWLEAEGKKTRVDYVTEYFNLPSHIHPYSVNFIGYPLKENANYFVDRYEENKVFNEFYQ